MLNVSKTLGAASLLFLFQSANVPPAHSDERHAVLTNNTHESITEIFVSDDSTDNWQEDHLGSDFLIPGNFVSIEVDDRNGNCRVDVKTVLATGQVSSTAASMLASPTATQFYSDKQVLVIMEWHGDAHPSISVATAPGNGDVCTLLRVRARRNSREPRNA